MVNIYSEILKNVFPKGYCMVFAYGSSVFKQLGHVSAKNTMMDFILAVEDPVEWHRENLIQNSSHYSSLKYGGPEYISRIQDKFGAKVYFNTLVPTYAGLIKYGVVSKENLISDLLDWETLYLSGRLHKPVNLLYKDDDEELKTALKINLYAALHTALLLLPETFTEQNLYQTITGLSYSGDFRMAVGEDRNKVRNIVGAQMSEFRKLYFPILKEMHDYVILDQGHAAGEQDVSPSTKFFHLCMLPKMLQASAKSSNTLV
ncbi:UNVERIFIED_CONTAM: hypothetical protein GTU68_060973 [Idotea baltica]|nr:hypothetical protein [Idotea baltica]